jgi:uncharacterized repeat protein (TIGR03803 family)
MRPCSGFIRESSFKASSRATTSSLRCLAGTNLGVVFKLNTTNKLLLLHSFSSVDDGANPVAGLIRDSAGNFYGTTCCGGNKGTLDGIAFKLTPTRRWTILNSFGASSADGQFPLAGLIRDKAGDLYGTTLRGGPFGFGTVFKIDTSGNENVLYNFSGGADGAYPQAGLLLGSSGNLYGTTLGGGSAIGNTGNGVVLKLATSTDQETVIHTFTGGTDGAQPYSGLICDSVGNLYGTTSAGGAFQWGNIFKIGSTGTETVLYRFTGGADGSCPMADLVRDSAGNLYGTTQFGGNAQAGVVFKLAA